MRTGSLKSLSFIILLATMGNRVLGFIRELIISYKFGASKLTDAYFISFSLPDLLNNLVISGLIGAGLLPVLVHMERRQSRDIKKVFSTVLNTTILFTLAVAVIIYTRSESIILFLAPGFDNYQIDIAAGLLRVMAIVPLFLAVSSTLRVVLQAEDRVALMSIAPIFYNIFFILTLLVFYKPDVTVLAFSVVIGSIFQMLVQLPALRKTGYSIRQGFSFNHPEVKQTYKIGVPAIFAMGIIELNNLVTKIAATGVGGSVSALNYSYKVLQLPLGVLAAAVSVASFSLISRRIAENDMQGLAELLGEALDLIVFMILPAFVIFVSFNQPIIKVLFLRGAFSMDALSMTAKALFVYSFSLIPLALVPLINNVFYAMGKSVDTLIIGITSVVINGILAFVLKNVLGLTGITLSFVGAAWAILIVSAVRLFRHLPPAATILSGLIEMWRILVSGLFMLGFCLTIAPIVLGGSVFLLMVAISMAVLIYFFASYIFGFGQTIKLCKVILQKVQG